MSLHVSVCRLYPLYGHYLEDMVMGYEAHGTEHTSRLPKRSLGLQKWSWGEGECAASDVTYLYDLYTIMLRWVLLAIWARIKLISRSPWIAV